VVESLRYKEENISIALQESKFTDRLNTSEPSENLYTELKQRVRAAGCLEPQPLYYAILIPVTMILLCSGWVAMAVVDHFWFRLAGAVFLAFISVQVGYLGHDAGHQQIFSRSWLNDLLGLVNGFSIGTSYSWWVDTHNRHHGRPNQISYDPAIEYSVLAFSKEEAAGKKGLLRLIVKLQAFLFFPLLMLYPISMRIDSFRYILRSRYRYRAVEAISLISYFPIYFLFLYLSMGLWQAIVFAVIHQSILGLYLSFVFVPNHMGMPVLDENAEPDFVRHQVLTARNIKGTWIVDYLFGGLNYQIEHHLFPRMPRNRLRHASRIVQAFLKEKSIQYCETGIFQSYRAILSYLHEIGKSLNH
jgi:fatty acid desaturase